MSVSGGKAGGTKGEGGGGGKGGGGGLVFGAKGLFGWAPAFKDRDFKTLFRGSADSLHTQ